MIQVVVAMLVFVIAALLLVGAVLSYELWQLHRSLARRRATYGPNVSDNQAA